MPVSRLNSDHVAQGFALSLVAVVVLLMLAPLVSASGAIERGEIQRAIQVVLFGMSSALTLAVAVIRPGRREFLWYGALCAVLALLGWLDAPEPVGLVARLTAPQRLQDAVLQPAGAAFALLFSAHIARRTRVWWLRSCLGLAALAVLVGLLPVPALAPVATSLTLAARLAALVGSARLLLAGWRDRIEGIGAIVLAGAFFSLATLGEFGVGGSILASLRFSGLLLFAVFVTTALILQLGMAADWYAGLVEQARDAILLVGPGGRVLEANPSAATLLGLSPRGTPFLDLVVDDDRARAGAYLELREPGRLAELRLAAPGGATVHVESVITPLPEDHALLVVRDITSRRELEAGLLDAARLETAAIIAGGVAHDFNNAMAALLAHVEMLRMQADDAVARRLDRMEVVIRRASMMTRRLVTAVRGGGGERGTVSLADPIESAAELTRSMLPADVTLELKIDADLPRVYASADELEQALLNLLLNARDAMSDTGGGVIRVCASRVVSGTWLGGALIAVEDEGAGVPEALRTRIWQPFFSTKGSGRGTGLGLAVVGRVAREHGGAVEVVDRREGKGARFEIYLPAAGHTATLSSGSVRLQTRALVVDDDADVREHMRAELAARGCTPTVAASAEEAELAFEAAGGAFDLLVTDVVLPGASGIALARSLTARRPGLAVLVVSGFIPENEPALNPRWGRLEKPFNSERFSLSVRRTMLRALRDAAGGETTSPP